MLSCYFQEEGCRHEWLNMIDRLVSSPRAVDASSAATLLRLLVERCSSPLTFSKHNSVMASSDDEPLECTPCIQTFRVLTYLIDLLRSHCSTASKNLSLIGIQAPMHGVLYCLRSILSYTSLRYSPVAFVFFKCITRDPLTSAPTFSYHVCFKKEELQDDSRLDNKHKLEVIIDILERFSIECRK